MAIMGESGAMSDPDKYANIPPLHTVVIASAQYVSQALSQIAQAQDRILRLLEDPNLTDEQHNTYNIMLAAYGDRLKRFTAGWSHDIEKMFGDLWRDHRGNVRAACPVCIDERYCPDHKGIFG